MHECPANSQLRNSLQNSRRTADTQIREIEPGLGDQILFMEEAKGRKDGRGMARNGRWAGAVRRHAD